MQEDQFVGEIRLFGGNVAPDGWALCNGQLLPISSNYTLFSLIGTTYGGDGETTFGLPDLRGRVPIHTDNNVYPVGQSDGLEQVVLTTDNLPAHTHLVVGATVGGLDQPKDNTWGLATTNVYASPGAQPIAMSTAGISTAGSGNAHDNMIPFMAVSYIIAMAGIYPSKPEEEESK